MAGISLFLFKEGSCNAFNNDRIDKDFVSNYRILFGMELPHMDTVDEVFRALSEAELDNFKKSMMQDLLEKKVLQKHRIFGEYYLVAIDGAGVMSFNKKNVINV